MRAGLNEKRALTAEAKLCCTKCNKQETSKTPLQACSRCRFVRYCGKECQLEHYKITHKRDCVNFQDPPLCHAFNCKSIFPGCSYTERPIFSKGVKNGMGCWISAGGSTDRRLATLPGGLKNRPGRNGPPPSMEQMMAMIPGAMDGRILTLTVLVQNRTPKATPMDVWYFMAMGTPAGTPIIMEGKTEGEKKDVIHHFYRSRCVGQTVVSVELTHFNGKHVKDKDSCPAILDQSCCAVPLKAGDYAQYTAEFRCGGPKVTRELQALELLDHIVFRTTQHSPGHTQT
ncbi:hypothetical protein FIBSPDRAFT_1021974 [Athelia psychrophila]|uniref:MYND-type domain-containing protein n=1 Tax=Athelia psychrophila TaxID=1759441 RepID=A0A167TI87_9AGAM|nr:hypothetical protein FIBSPDRAFT_1021974 [Fibularhizoctonia sp. CBS 109695]